MRKVGSLAWEYLAYIETEASAVCCHLLVTSLSCCSYVSASEQHKHGANDQQEKGDPTPMQVESSAESEDLRTDKTNTKICIVSKDSSNLPQQDTKQKDSINQNDHCSDSTVRDQQDQNNSESNTTTNHAEIITTDTPMQSPDGSNDNLAEANKSSSEVQNSGS